MDDNKFWNSTLHAEEQFTGMADVVWFRTRMRRLGHDPAVIRERVEEIHPSLVARFDRLERGEKELSEEAVALLRRMANDRTYPAPGSAEIGRAVALKRRGYAVNQRMGGGWRATDAGRKFLEEECC